MWQKTSFFQFALVTLLIACGPSPAPLPTLTPPSPTSLPAPTQLDSTRSAEVPFLEATPAGPLDARGTFVYAAGDGSLWQQNAGGGEPAPLVERSVEAIAQMPAYSPDGRLVAYSALLFLPDGNLRGDIRLINVDGSLGRTLLEPEANDIVYFYPRFGADGRMLVTRIDNLQTTDERAWLEWVNLAEEVERTRVVDDARDGDVSRDGKQIAFVRVDVVSTRSSLWTAAADGTNQREVVAAETFNSIMSPRFSPDGNWLAFSVHGVPQKDLPMAYSSSCLLNFLFTCLLHSAEAHSAPGAVWRVNLQSGKFQQLTDIYDDSPMSAWSRDGLYLAIHDFTGIRLIDLSREKIYPLFLEDGGSGGFDWTEAVP